MAFVFLPVAFVYLLPAAIFFWLSKDVITAIFSKAAGFITSISGKALTKTKDISGRAVSKTKDISGRAVSKTKDLTEKAASKTKDLSDKAAKMKADFATQNKQQETEQDTTIEDTLPESVPNNTTPDSAPVSQDTPTAPASPQPEEPTSAQEEDNTAPSAPPEPDDDGQMTIDETAAAKATETEVPAKTSEKDEAAAEEVISDTAEDKPADEAEAAEETKTEQEPTAGSSPKPQPTAAAYTAPVQVAPGVTQSIRYDNDDKEPIDIFAGARRGLRSALGKVKSLAPAGKIGDRSDDEADYGYNPDGADTSRRGTSAGWASSRIDEDFRDLDSSDVEEVIKRQFDTLDMITTSAIAIMLSDTKTKAASPFIRELKKPDIRLILLKFCQDTYFATDIEQLNSLFNKSYYKWKITRYLGKITVFVKRGIGDSLPRRTAFRKARITKNRFINKICETINTFESVKYISALSGNEEISDSKRNYKLDHLSENYKDALIYLVDLLLTCTCISKMLFVERMIRNMDPNSEFNKIITNMAHSIDNHNLIISKSRPIYKQYYQSELGYINGDDLLYGMAITIMVNRAKKVDIKNTEVLHVNHNVGNTREFKQDMLKWLDALSREDSVEDIGTLILQRITLSINDNYGLLTNALQELTNWENYYNQRVAFYKKEKDRERYLKGDFEKEKEEIVKIR